MQSSHQKVSVFPDSSVDTVVFVTELFISVTEKIDFLVSGVIINDIYIFL